MSANLDSSKSSQSSKDQKKEFLDWLESLKISKYWLDTMNQSDSLSLCKEIYQALQHFRTLALSEREKVFALFEIDSCMQGIYEKLHEEHLNAKIPLIPEKQVPVDLIIESHLELARAYCEVMIDDKSRNSQVSDHYLAITSCKAFQALGIVFLTVAEIYTHLPKGFWLLSYSLFSLSEKYNLLDNKVRVDKTIYSAAVLFERLIVFYFIDKEKCSPDEIEKVFYALLRGINYIQSYIPAATEIANSANHRIFGFSLTKDEAPSLQSNMPLATAKLLRYVEKHEVINIIQFLLRETKSHPQLKSASPETFNSILLSLEPQKRKRQTRINKKYRCRSIIGLDNLVDFLLKKEQKKLLGAKKKINEKEDDFDAFSLSLEWDSDTKMAEENPVIDNLEIIDSTMNGYGILWNHAVAGKLQIGDAVGIIPDFSSATEKFEIGLVRRIYVVGGSVRFGIELIGLESTLIHISRNPSETGEWALFLFGSPNYEVGILCHKEHHYQTGEAVFVQLPEKKLPCNLGVMLNSTPLLDHIALSY